MGKVILHLCADIGSDSKPYRDAGYEVVCVGEKEDVRTYFPPMDNVYGIIANPPCTMFSLARTRAKTPRDIEGALAVVSACIRIIYVCRPKFWVIENPMGLLRSYLGQPRLTIQPYWFGDSYSKQTDLWGEFNIPKFSPVRLTPEEIHAMKTNTRKLTDIGLSRADHRAVAPKNFAQAFYEANK
jgi:site-specific DNA-cytosine methylase